VDEERLVLELGVLGLHRGEDRGEDDAAGALDVVVEARDVRAVLVEEARGVLAAKVLKVDKDARPKVLRRLDKGVDKAVVLGPAVRALLAQAEVELVVEQVLVVGADVEHDREHARWVDTSASTVDLGLADADRDARGEVRAREGRSAFDIQPAATRQATHPPTPWSPMPRIWPG
jgi:hypothetical protein